MSREAFEVLDATGSEEGAATGAEFIPDLLSYDNIIVCQSGGKDSLALLLHLLDLDVAPERIECHHHLVDGREGSRLMDWEVTEAYCEALCKALGVALTFSWREGGIERELLRDGTPTAPVLIPASDGGYMRVGGQGPAGVRRKFPQVSANLSVRWCSAANKIDVFDRYVCNHPKFIGKRTLVLTGERAEESASRAKYKVFETHRADRRNSSRVPRHVDVWRAVHSWSEQRVWALIEKWKVQPHPAYEISFGRVSCRQCVFSGKNQWASVRVIAPVAFQSVADYERVFNVTIHRKDTVVQRADAGTPYVMDPKWVAIATGTRFDEPIFVENWTLPPGAYGEGCGPT
jgi:3'-phosphoadenosine 5'-phosphosulfate sulfotransferase (PAPS reductase)/FAD synthetase